MENVGSGGEAHRLLSGDGIILAAQQVWSLPSGNCSSRRARGNNDSRLVEFGCQCKEMSG